MSTKPKKGCLGCLGVLVVLFVLMGLIANSATKHHDDLFKSNSITEEQGEVISETFKSVGVDLYALKYTDMYDNHFYEGDRGFIWNNGAMTDIVIVDNNNVIRKINYRGTPLYADGQVVSQISDHKLADDEFSDYKIKTETLVTNMLKSPSTADFAGFSDWNIWKESGIVIVQSYVDSQNGFGATVRSDFQVKYEGDNVISFILDGQEIMSQ